MYIKKICKLSLILLIALSLLGCSNKTIQWDEPTYLSFEEMLDIVNNSRDKSAEFNEKCNEFIESIKNVDECRTLSQDEIIDLLNFKEKKNVNNQEALQDIDIFFRLLRYAYAPYDYFKQENFEQAKQKAIDSLNNKNDISVDDLSNVLINSLDFVVDKFIEINGTNLLQAKNKNYESFYDVNQQFSKDDNGFYKSSQGNKYYVDYFDNENITIEPTLLEDGHIVYAAVLLSSSSVASINSKVHLKSENDEIAESVNLKKSSNYELISIHNENIAVQQVDNIGYISVRSFEREYNDKLSSEFVNKASTLKNCDAIILDIRSNGGGEDSYGKQWIKNLTGKNPDSSMFKIIKINAINQLNSYNNERNDIQITKANYISNNIPIVVLVDSISGNENFINLLNTIDNVIVIGSNYPGYNFTANGTPCYLPNSGLNVVIPAYMSLNESFENTCEKGYSPDIWCNGKLSYEYIVNMLETNSVICSDTSEKLIITDKENKYKGPDGLVIKFDAWFIEPDGRFGRVHDESLDVYYDNEIIKDYEVYTDNSDLRISNIDGKLTIECPDLDGDHFFQIIYKGQTYNFNAER